MHASARSVHACNSSYEMIALRHQSIHTSTDLSDLMASRKSENRMERASACRLRFSLSFHPAAAAEKHQKVGATLPRVGLYTKRGPGIPVFQSSGVASAW